MFGEEEKYFYPKIIGDIGICGPPDLRWNRPYTKKIGKSKISRY